MTGDWRGHGQRVHEDPDLFFPSHGDPGARPERPASAAPFAVIDAKYKVKGPTRDDMCQLVTCCAALWPKCGYVISPGNPADSVPHKIRDSDVTIVGHHLDPAVPPADVLRQVRDLAEDIMR